MKKNRLIVNKTIYAKRFSISKKQFHEILELEVETHLRNNPDLEFNTVGEKITNADRSETFPLLFKLKNPAANTKVLRETLQ